MGRPAQACPVDEGPTGMERLVGLASRPAHRFTTHNAELIQLRQCHVVVSIKGCAVPEPPKSAVPSQLVGTAKGAIELIQLSCAHIDETVRQCKDIFWEKALTFPDPRCECGK